eukprot:6317687-Amphidinium_carterae.1
MATGDVNDGGVSGLKLQKLRIAQSGIVHNSIQRYDKDKVRNIPECLPNLHTTPVVASMRSLAASSFGRDV